MDAAERQAVRSAAFRAIRTWVREENPRVLFDPPISVSYRDDQDAVGMESLTVALAEMAAKFLVALHLNAEGDQATPEEMRTAREAAEAWLDGKMLEDLEAEFEPGASDR